MLTMVKVFEELFAAILDWFLLEVGLCLLRQSFYTWEWKHENK